MRTNKKKYQGCMKKEVLNRLLMRGGVDTNKYNYTLIPVGGDTDIAMIARTPKYKTFSISCVECCGIVVWVNDCGAHVGIYQHPCKMYSAGKLCLEGILNEIFSDRNKR